MPPPSTDGPFAEDVTIYVSLLGISCPNQVQVPFLFKYTVDSLTADPTALTPATVMGVLALTPPALIVGYGVARAGAALCNEARNAVFAQAGGEGGCGWAWFGEFGGGGQGSEGRRGAAWASPWAQCTS